MHRSEIIATDAGLLAEISATVRAHPGRPVSFVALEFKEGGYRAETYSNTFDPVALMSMADALLQNAENLFRQQIEATGAGPDSPAALALERVEAALAELMDDDQPAGVA